MKQERRINEMMRNDDEKGGGEMIRNTGENIQNQTSQILNMDRVVLEKGREIEGEFCRLLHRRL